MGNIRCGEIDMFRFVFAIVIVCNHFNAWHSFLRVNHGDFGVEFFFLLTVFFMAKHAKHIGQKEKVSVSSEL